MRAVLDNQIEIESAENSALVLSDFIILRGSERSSLCCSVKISEAITNRVNQAYLAPLKKHLDSLLVFGNKHRAAKAAEANQLALDKQQEIAESRIKHLVDEVSNFVGDYQEYLAWDISIDVPTDEMKICFEQALK